MLRTLLVTLTILAVAFPVSAQNKREQKVRADLKKIANQGFWIYNDLPRGITKAKETGKPLLVVFRCIPCEACAQLDAQVVDRDKAVRALMDKFVCVRIVHANGLDMSLFQYDYDQSFAAFFLNADKTIYGRYGTRSHQHESKDDVHIDGFAAAMRGALKLHANYPKVRKSLLAKHGGKPLFPVPEKSAKLRGKQYTSKLNYKGNVVRSCIHCHQVGEAQRFHFKSRGKKIPEKVLFPYPHPKALGLILDPKTKATVKTVKPGSIAAKSGFKRGDAIESLSGQPILSIADVQWVLQNTGESADLKATVLRDGQSVDVTLSLPKGWRRLDDIAWRATSWSLRRMATGGMRLEEVPAAERKRRGIPDGKMALRIKHLGRYGAHRLALKTGFRVGDVLLSFDGKTDLLRPTDILTYAVNAKKPGERVEISFLRGRRKMTLRLPMQK